MTDEPMPVMLGMKRSKWITDRAMEDDMEDDLPKDVLDRIRSEVMTLEDGNGVVWVLAQDYAALSTRLAEAERKIAASVLLRACERDEALARVAYAYECAARRARYYEKILPSADQRGYGMGRSDAADAIRALATPAERDALARIRAEERERCAKVADEWRQATELAEGIAAAIREGDDT